MNANTKKFLSAYNQIDAVENTEVIGKVERLAKEKLVAKLNKDLNVYGSRITEDQMEFLGDLCCEFEDIKNTYIV